jgi:hypothetical protein
MKGVIYQIWYKHKCKLRKTFLTPSYVEVNEATGTWITHWLRYWTHFLGLAEGSYL